MGAPVLEPKRGGSRTRTPNIATTKDIFGFDNRGPSGRAATVRGGMESIQTCCVFVREDVNPQFVCRLNHIPNMFFKPANVGLSSSSDTQTANMLRASDFLPIHQMDPEFLVPFQRKFLVV